MVVSMVRTFTGLRVEEQSLPVTSILVVFL